MDPERPIEKLLRQAAQARRTQAGAPQELHPATRRMLQGELARKYAAGARRERRSFFELFMPRLAWGAALIVGLGLAASLMLPRKNAPQQEMFFAKNDRVTMVATDNESRARAVVPSEKVAPAAPRPDSSALADADSLRVAQAERDKDSLNVERRRAESGRTPSLALNEPAAATATHPKGEAEGIAGQSNETQSHTGTVGGSLAREKQKEQLAETYTAVAPAQTPATEEKMVQRRFGLAQPSQPALAPAAPGAAGVTPSSVLKLGDETSKTELAYKSLSQQTTTNASSLGVQLKTAAAADGAKRSPAPIVQATQQFVQVASPNKTAELADKRSATKPILFSFELQQLGREVRIIDSDGSVYSGSFQPAEVFSYLESPPSEKAAVTRSLQTTEALSQRKDAFADSKLQTDMSYAFKVVGTNQTLKQIVTFTGQVLAPTNALSLVAPAGTVNGNRVARPELNPLPLQNSRVAGKALIGTNQEIEVNAIPSH
jgi:hypothetical protein